MSYLLIFLMIPTVFSYNLQSYDFATDLEKLMSTGKCNTCLFNASEFTTVTIEQWPTNCADVCSIAKFTSSSSDIPYEKLKTVFKNLKILRGVLRIENTKFTNLSFFGKLDTISNIKYLVTSIMDNSNLKDSSLLFSLSWTYPNSPIQIVNNKKLDVSALCESVSYTDFAGMYVYNNMKDCGCIGANLTSSNIESYSNCTSFFGDTLISNSSDFEKFFALSNVKNITGRMVITNTDFPNLSFFKNVERMKGNMNEVNLDIHDNPNLTRLGFDSLNNLYNVAEWFVVNIYNVHPDFCLTMEEMRIFAASNIHFDKFEAKYCNITTRKDGAKTCIFEKLSTLDNDCVHVMGNVLITSGDESSTGKLKSVKNIYGSLTITNTTLSSLDFLGNLTNVAVLNDSSPAISLISNPSLSDITLPSLEFPFSTGPHRVVIQNNSPEIFIDYYQCLNYQNEIKSYVFYNGGDCLSIVTGIVNGNGGSDVAEAEEVAGGNNTCNGRKYSISLILTGIFSIRLL